MTGSFILIIIKVDEVLSSFSVRSLNELNLLVQIVKKQYLKCSSSSSSEINAHKHPKQHAEPSHT